jgi:ABC-type Fe3+/spermidine/putrescine transport system ATPase subunit
VVRVVNLTKRLGAFQLRGVSFELAQGDYGVLLGPTGCGKTVLLETIVGINRPDAGEVWLDGQDVTRWAPERRGIGFVYQRSMLFPNLSVRGNIAYGLRYYIERGERPGVVDRVAELVGVRHLLDRGIAGLSGGEMQKVALARALAIEPRVLLFDEPLAPLDPPSKEALCAEIAALHRQLGTTILHVTHDQEEARILGKTIGVLRDGRLLQFGPRDEVFDRPSSAFVARFLGTENVFAGEAVAEGGFARIALGCGGVRAKTALTGTVGMCVRPELVSIVAQPPAAVAGARKSTAEGGCATNSLSGRVESVSDRGALVRYDVATAREPFVVLQTKRDYAAAGLAVGQAVTLGFEPDAVHVFRWHDEPPAGLEPAGGWAGG